VPGQMFVDPVCFCFSHPLRDTLLLRTKNMNGSSSRFIAVYPSGYKNLCYLNTNHCQWNAMELSNSNLPALHLVGVFSMCTIQMLSIVVSYEVLNPCPMSMFEVDGNLQYVAMASALHSAALLRWMCSFNLVGPCN
jgi:hypothetical protein